MQQRQPRSRTPRALALESLERRQLLTTSAPSYLLPSAPGVEITPLLTVGEAAANGYQMAGIPDGLGAFDNGDGTFTVLMNHELRPDRGAVHAHGSKGAFVSKWIIDKATGNVLFGEDLIKQVHLYDALTGSYLPLTTAFNRFCSADLAEPTAYFNPATGLGTTAPIFMDGEENSIGRAFAHIVSTGQSYELPWIGKYAFENVVASPFPQDKTIVAGLDDSSRNFSSEAAPDPSEVYFYLGTKKSTGTEVEKAGLIGGILTGMRVLGRGNEAAVVGGDHFELSSLGDVSAKTAAQLQADSIAAGITQFRRVEDGHWDPTNPNVFRYVTTDQFGGDTRLWKLTFTDITRPELGGRIDIDITSPAAAPGEMFDNITTNANGDTLLQEDPGNQPHLARVWQQDDSTGDLIEIAHHNPGLFLDRDRATPGVQSDIDIDPATSGNNGTQDEESSGIIDLSHILGTGYYLVDVQAHYALPDPFVEAGQLLLINTNAPKAFIANGTLSVHGTVNDDQIAVSRLGQTLTVTISGQTLGQFDNTAVQSLHVIASGGSDSISVAANVLLPAILDGGVGHDSLSAGSGRSILIGGTGTDQLTGGANDDILIGNATTSNDASLLAALANWDAPTPNAKRVSSLRPVFSGTIIADGAADLLAGKGGKDWFFADDHDDASDRISGESVN